MATTETKFSHWLFREYQPIYKGLAVYRVFFGLFILMGVLPRYLWISNYPDTFFFPRLGLTLFFSGFPDAAFFYVLNFLLIFSAISLIVGYKTFFASIALAGLLLIGNSWAYSFGAINHEIFLLIIPLFLARAWKGSNLEQKPEDKSGWAVAAIALMVALAMLTAVVPKVLNGWLDPSAAALSSHLSRSFFLKGEHTIWAELLLASDNMVFLKFLDYSAVLIEFAFVVSIFSLRYFRLVCAFACLLHFWIQLTMGISFLPYLLVYAIFVNWNYLHNINFARKRLHKLSEVSRTVTFGKVTIAAFLVWGVYIWLGNPFRIKVGIYEILGGNLINSILMIGAVVISLYYLTTLVVKKQQRVEEHQEEEVVQWLGINES